jgi:hypothetical protein
MPKLPYDPDKDLVPVANAVKAVNVLVVTPPAGQVDAELIAYAKANPGKLNFLELRRRAQLAPVGELFKMLAGIDIVHVPYRGSGPSIQDMLAGNIQMSIDTVVEHAAAHPVRRIARHRGRHHREESHAARAADDRRDLAGFDGSRSTTRCRRMPQPVIDRLNRSQRVLTDPEVPAHGRGSPDGETSRPGPARKDSREVEEGDRADQMIR